MTPGSLIGRKKRYFDALSKLFDAFDKTLLVGSLNVGSQSLSKIRAELRAVDGLLSQRGVMHRRKAVEYLWSNEYDGLRELFAEPGEESEEELDSSDIGSDEELDLSDAMQYTEDRYKGLLNVLDSADESDLKILAEVHGTTYARYRASLKNNEEICEEYNCDPKHKEKISASSCGIMNSD